MGYDKELDKEISKKVLDFGNTQIIVSIHSYDGGTSKIQIGRLNKHPENDEWSFSKLGRLTKDEALGVATALTNIVVEM